MYHLNKVSICLNGCGGWHILSALWADIVRHLCRSLLCCLVWKVAHDCWIYPALWRHSRQRRFVFPQIRVPGQSASHSFLYFSGCILGATTFGQQHYGVGETMNLTGWGTWMDLHSLWVHARRANGGGSQMAVLMMTSATSSVEHGGGVVGPELLRMR